MAAPATTVEDGLWAVFEAYASFGDRDAHSEVALDSFRWTKLLREAGVHEPGFGANATDVAWAKCCPRGTRRMCFDTFIIGLGLVAESKWPGLDPAEAFAALVSAVLALPGPALTGVAPAPPSTSTGIFQKLTDASLYTGTHRLRFDGEGRGLGLAGRDAIPHGAGTHPAPAPPGAPIHDLSQLLRPGMARGGTQLSSPPRASARRRPPQSPPRGGAGAAASHSPRGTPSSSHFASDGARRRADAPASGSPRVDSGGASRLSATPRLRLATSLQLMAAGGEGGPLDAGGDLSSLGAVFQAYAVFGGSASGARGDELSSTAFAKLCREAGVVGAGGGGAGCVPPSSVDVAYAKARGPHRRTLDYDGFLFALQLLALEVYPAQAASGDPADALAVTARLAQRMVAAGGPALNLSRSSASVVAAQAMAATGGDAPPHYDVFTKLTDHRFYTGAHVHRFDDDGLGRGRAGREGGDGEQAATAGDLSQLLRRRPGH